MDKFRTNKKIDGVLNEVLHPYWTDIRPNDGDLHCWSIDRWYGACEHILGLTNTGKLPPTVLHGRDWDKRRRPQ